mmetsp:Transcript_64081/g.139465  ORF Transcript_64081/g.139465 Transcript_64081/m.139465 type:complete len:116 (-) Transcript_64081:560-907(-)
MHPPTSQLVNAQRTVEVQSTPVSPSLEAATASRTVTPRWTVVVSVEVMGRVVWGVIGYPSAHAWWICVAGVGAIILRVLAATVCLIVVVRLTSAEFVGAMAQVAWAATAPTFTPK